MFEAFLYFAGGKRSWTGNGVLLKHISERIRGGYGDGAASMLLQTDVISIP